MKKFTLGIIFLTVSYGLKAQESIKDSVTMGASYANEVYYKLEDGAKSAVSANGWHLGFSTNSFSVTILSNAANTSVAIWPNGTNADFETVDTTGFYTWPKLVNDSLDFEIGAFNQNSTGGLDYGWGKYNVTSHKIMGDSVYIVKVGTAAYKVDFISKDAGVMNLRFTDVANTSATEQALALPNYSSKNFAFLDLTTGNLLDREMQDWDLWAVKYHDMYNVTIPNQSVVGILTNPKWEVAVVEVGAGSQESRTDFSQGSFTSDKNALGQSYKSMNVQYQWEVTNSKVYYLQNTDGDVWKWYPTSFVGTSMGKTVFYKQKMASVGINEQSTQFIGIYPNPAKDQLNIVFDSKASTVDVTVRNQMGQIVYQETTNSGTGITQQKLDISSYTNGMYFLEINQNGYRTVKSIIKN